MQLCKIRLESGEARPGFIEGGKIHLLKSGGFLGVRSLADVLHNEDPREAARELVDERARSIPFSEARLLAPVDDQEIWAAGVTYKRSQQAREQIGRASCRERGYVTGVSAALKR